jgi:SprT protein
MPKQEAHISSLQNYLPAGTYDATVEYLQRYNVHLTIARERKSILGDYRHRTHHHNHRISVNGNLNKYSFLITLLHEMAHLLTFEQYGNRVQAHGKEWKMVYGKLLEKFINNHLFPADIENELLRSLKNPAASSCAEDGLIRVLRKYDDKKSKVKLIEELREKELFTIENGRVFQKGERIRKRYKCTEVKTGKVYLFSPVYEVEVVSRE